MPEIVGRAVIVGRGVTWVVGLAVGVGLAVAVGRGVGLTVGRTVGLTVGFEIRGVAVFSGAGVPGTMSATPSPESPERRMGW